MLEYLKGLLQTVSGFHSNLKKRGALGEKLARQHLEKKGYTIIDSNWRCFAGEIDIVAYKDDELVFCEVKSLHSDLHGYDPSERVNRRKIRKLKDLAEYFRVSKQRKLKALRLWNYRFDIISVCIRSGARPVIEHIEDAFS